MKGILVPDSNVVKPFLKRHKFERAALNGGTFLSNKLQDVVVVSGAIGEKSYEVALNLVENYSPNFIISVGFAASLRDEVPRIRLKEKIRMAARKPLKRMFSMVN